MLFEQHVALVLVKAHPIDIALVERLRGYGSFVLSPVDRLAKVLARGKLCFRQDVVQPTLDVLEARAALFSCCNAIPSKPLEINVLQLAAGHSVQHGRNTACSLFSRQKRAGAPKSAPPCRRQATFKFVADSLPLFRSASTSYVTFMPSARPLMPDRSTALICTNTSLPPWSGWINP